MVLAVTAVPLHAGETVSFKRDVMAVLSRAGCNGGSCHGNFEGKGGFRLSIFGEDPAFDLAALLKSRTRVDVDNPADSLIVRKPTLQTKHEGGRRFEIGSAEHQILLNWIKQGAKADAPGLAPLTSLQVTPSQVVVSAPDWRVPVQVEAIFADGFRRDVTHLVRFEPTDLLAKISPDGVISSDRAGETTVLVRYMDQQAPVRIAFVQARPDFAWSNPRPLNFIDEHIFAKLRRLRMNPSDVADDSTFIRRAYLDIIGTLPTSEEARQFVADNTADKRARLIDQLLQRPEFADYWTLKWSDLLRNEEKTLDETGVAKFHGWIRNAMAENRPLDQFARQLVTARGSSYDNPPSNFYRAMRTPTTRSETVAQLFLGTRLQCAQCHNHPYERITQESYWQFAALFSGIDYQIIENLRRDKSDKNMFIGEQIILASDDVTVKDPKTGTIPTPEFFDGTQLPSPADVDPLVALGDWLTDPQTGEGRRFAQVQVNRIWYHLMGRGIVEPIDDFRMTNPPINEPLLRALTDEFIASGFDLKHMIRLIATSRTYQLSSEPNADNAEDQVNFSHALVQRLPAEVMADAIAHAMEAPVTYDGYDRPMRAIEVPGVNKVFRNRDPSAADRFLTLFGKPPRLLATECERTSETALGQVFELTSGRLIDNALNAETNRLTRLLESDLSDEQVVTELFWSTVTRKPTDQEMAAIKAHIASTGNRRAALEDVAWGLLNAKEFVLRY